MGKYTLHPDVSFSRRKRLHHILDDHDCPVWSGQRIAAAFAWLWNEGENEFRLEGETTAEHFLVMIQAD